MFTLNKIKGAILRHGLVHIEQFSLNFFKSVLCNPSQSSPLSTILVPFWFIITSLVFFCLIKLIFCGFPHVEGYFARTENDLKYRKVAPLNSCTQTYHRKLPGGFGFGGEVLLTSAIRFSSFVSSVLMALLMCMES